MAEALRVNSRMMRAESAPSRAIWVGVGLVAVIGLLHLIEAPEYWGEVHYIGALFVVAALGSILATVGIARGERWGWALGLAIAIGNGAGYVLSRTVGIPQFRENSWSSFLEPMGLASLAVEILFILLAVWAMSRWGDANTE